MRLDIPHSPKRKLIDQIKIHLAIKAISESKNRTEVAEYIGITDRAFRKWLNKYEELRPYKKTFVSKTPYWDDGPSWRPANASR